MSILVGWLWFGPFAERPLVVTGTVHAAGRPVEGAYLTLTRGTWRGEVWTSPKGEFQVEAPSEGPYSVQVGMSRHSPGSVYRTHLTRSEPQLTLSLEIPPVEINFVDASGAPIHDMIQFGWDGPLDSSRVRSGLGVVPPKADGAVKVLGWAEGRYRIAAYAHRQGGGGLAELTLTAGSAQPLHVIRLERRPGIIRTVGPEGMPVAATAFAAGHRLGRSQTEFPLQNVVPGQEVLIIAEGYAPVCVIAQPSMWPETIVTLAAAPWIGRLTLRNSTAAIGALAGYPGTQCDVPLKEIGQAESKGDALVISGLPVPQAPADVTFVAPGHPRALIDLDAGSTVEFPRDFDACLRTFLRPGTRR